MRRLSWAYILGVLFIAFALCMAAFARRPQETTPVWLFVCLMLITSLQRIFRVVAPGNKVYESSTIGLFASALLLPPWLFVVVVVVAHVTEWVRERLARSDNLRAWYIQPFNIAKCIIGGAATYAVTSTVPILGERPWTAMVLLAIVLAIGLYVLVNQFLLGLALMLARGITFGEAGILRDALLIEMPLASMSFIAAYLSQRSVLLALFAMAPIVMIYQAFLLPKLQYEAMSALQRANRELIKANQSVQQLNDELLVTLAKVFDLRDPQVGNHVAQVAVYATIVAAEMKLDTERIEMIRHAAYLHDIGKLGIPESILNKPQPLTEGEFKVIRRHSDIGADLLAATQGLQHLAPIVRYHHERWDGAGYPSGLSGEQIPLEARILGACDAVEAMSSDRPYRRAKTVPQVIEELRQCANSQFDPAVVQALIQSIERKDGLQLVNSVQAAKGYNAQVKAGDTDSRDQLRRVMNKVHSQLSYVSGV